VTTIGITGATGRVGGRVASKLAGAGVDMRLLVRDVQRAPTLGGASAAAMSSYGDAAAVREALDGVRVVLMVSASEAADRLEQHRTFIDAAAAAGVEHLVYTSFAGAAEDCTFTLGRDHWATEQHIRRSGMQLTALRDNFYSDLMSALVGDDGTIRGPAGNGRVASVAVDDVADVAAAVLLDSAAHADKTYTLTGPESLTLNEAAALLSKAQGRPVEYVSETVEEAYASRASYGAEQWQLDAWVSTYTAIARGEVATVSDDVERLTGHPALSLADLLASGRAAY
jgi:uncharacterized protein YbjT (DUF2867 family)